MDDARLAYRAEHAYFGDGGPTINLECKAMATELLTLRRDFAELLKAAVDYSDDIRMGANAGRSERALSKILQRHGA